MVSCQRFRFGIVLVHRPVRSGNSGGRRKMVWLTGARIIISLKIASAGSPKAVFRQSLRRDQEYVLASSDAVLWNEAAVISWFV